MSSIGMRRRLTRIGYHQCPRAASTLVRRPQKPLEGMLNKFIIGLIRAALGVKRQREEAERRERQRQEDERKRQEEAQRL
jgi:hypothetical protein